MRVVTAILLNSSKSQLSYIYLIIDLIILADNSITSSYSLLKAKNWKQWVADGFGFVS